MNVRKSTKYFTPIEKINNAAVLCKAFKDNELYVKRDDLLPSSFGGNKARIGAEYLKDAKEKGCDTILAYGSSSSNMCRVISSLCASEGLFCHILSAEDDNGEYKETYNSLLFGSCGFDVTICKKHEVGESVERVMKMLRDDGRNPYYIFDDNNIATATRAYEKAYCEIISAGTDFDMIFVPVGTGLTFTGLLSGQEKLKQELYVSETVLPKIVGITVSRTVEVEKEYVSKYLNLSGCASNTDFEIYDAARLGGYGDYNADVLSVCKNFYKNTGIGLDPIYSGKALYGVYKYIEENNIYGKRILFIHTGSAPLFFEKAEEIFG